MLPQAIMITDQEDNVNFQPLQRDLEQSGGLHIQGVDREVNKVLRRQVPPFETDRENGTARSNGGRSRGWCFTLNNPTEVQILIPQSWPNSEVDETGYKYLVYQLERGESGTPHLQGYVYYATLKSLKQMRELFTRENQAHWECARGTPRQNQKYCTKNESRIDGPWEFGDVPVQGLTNHLLEVKRLLDQEVPLIEIARNHENLYGTIIRNQRSLAWYGTAQQTERNWKMDVRVYWGDTGTGKSRACLAEFPGAYWKPRNTNDSNYFDGYSGQSVIIVDEFYGWFKWEFILKFIDRYPLLLDVRYGSTQCLAKTIVFTSNRHPKTWYKNPYYEWDKTNPLKRRITYVREFVNLVEEEDDAVVYRPIKKEKIDVFDIFKEI